MADFVFNIAKGRVVEYYNRVKNNDPASSALILVPLSVTGTEAQGQDFATLALVLADVNFDEQTTGGWVRKTLTDAELASFPGPDNSANEYDIPIPTVTFTGPTTGHNTVGLLVCYDSDTGAGTDANIIPLTHHVFTVTADGNDVVINTGNFFAAA